MTKRVLIINPTQSTGETLLPYLWLCLKAHHTEYGVKQDVQWLPPIVNIHGHDFADLVDLITSQAPDVVGFSNYVWNAKLNEALAQATRAALPACKIVFGGPHIDYRFKPAWFSTHPYVDVICSLDSFGEDFFTAYLDDVPINEVPGAVYPTKLGWLQSPIVTDKRKFRWPANVFAHSMDYLQELTTRAELMQTEICIEWETARGCPFGCTFCEWGGGTNSKVTGKPQETLEAELAAIAELKVSDLRIIDANFGILKRDIWIAEQLVDMSKAGHLRGVWPYGKNKNNKDVVVKIDTLFFDAGLYDKTMYLVAINATTKEMLADVKRTNVPIEDNLAIGKMMREKYGTRIALEIILGLPSATLDTFYAEADLFDAVDDWSTERYPWAILPETPANVPAYRAKHGIIKASVQYYYGDDVLQQQATSNASRELFGLPEYRSSYDIVVGTTTYTQTDWAQMYFMDHVIRGAELANILTGVRKHAQREFGLTAGQFYKVVWSCLYDSTDAQLNEQVRSIFADIMLITKGEYQHEFKYFKTPMSPNWVKLETTTRHLLHNYKKPFWTQLCQMLGVDMTHQAVIDGMSRCDDIDTPIEL